MFSDKLRLTGELDPEVDDRIVFQGYSGFGYVDIDMPYISHIHGNLWVGGTDYYIKLPRHFRYVVSLYPCDYTIEHKLDGHYTHILADAVDQNMSKIDDIARIAVAWEKKGDVLIHCQAGMNRSCLIASRVLQANGFTPRESVDILRERRTPYALINPLFEGWTLENSYRTSEA